MKYKIIDIYSDLHNLVTDNPYLTADDRFNDIMNISEDIDLVISEEFGERELFQRLLKEDSVEFYTYDLTKIMRSVYASFVAHLSKYDSLLTSYNMFKEYDPDADYKEVKTWGEKEKYNTYGQSQQTDVHGAQSESYSYGAQSETTTYGNENVTRNTGQSTDSTTNGATSTTNSVMPSFASTFANSDKVDGASSTDSTTYGARQDSEEKTHGNDTLSKTAHSDSKSVGTYTDTHTNAERNDYQREPETIDTREGYDHRLEQIEKYTEYGKRLELLRTIANDVANQVSYNMYL